MALLTIGAFAQRCRLSAKALRLYDGLGLLKPSVPSTISTVSGPCGVLTGGEHQQRRQVIHHPLSASIA